ncbi:penicillin-binding protein, partial [Streptomyces sp. TRM76130]|nr:penicillin-binding protein [Streptomyces sp. TRM76130]
MSDEPQPRPPAPGRDARSEDTTAPDPGGGRPKRPRRTGWRRLVPTWRLALGTVLAVAVLLVGGFLLGYSLVKIPSANALATQQSNVYL